MFDLNPPPSSERSAPRHFWYHEQEQYRVKVQRFSRVPPEVTVQRISFDRDARAYENAYENGASRTTPKRRSRSAPADRDAESLERSQRRSKTTVRKTVTELAPTALVTFTTRETMPLDALLDVWGRFTRLMRLSGIEFEYVAVPEPHPTNPDHYHLHAAYRGRTPFNVMRRFWHIALEARHGRAVRCILRGSESPGNVQVERIKARNDLNRIRKIAKYVSKYITKDLIAAFNRRRYWPSQGISLASAEAYWLDSLDASSAIREACILVGEWDFENGVPTQRMFRPSDRVCWFAVDPASTPPPF